MKKVIAGIGEVLWDVIDGKKLPGGAPANFAGHFLRNDVRSEYECMVVSAVGRDNDGQRLKEAFSDAGLVPVFQETGFPTGRVEVRLSKDGVPEYDFPDGSAWDNIAPIVLPEGTGSRLAAVCFGSLAQRSPVSRTSILAFLDSLGKDVLKIFDANLRGTFYDRETLEASLRRCNILKINESELSVLVGYGLCSETDSCRNLMSEYALRCLILTSGADGSYVYYTTTETPDVRESYVPAGDVPVVDTVGAGDSFTGAFVASILSGHTVEQAHESASAVAGFVCTVSGALPDYLADEGYVMRKAIDKDISDICEIFQRAKVRRERDGVCLGTDKSPLRENIVSDIEKGYGYVVQYEGRIVAYGAVVFDGDSAYSAWKGRWSADGPYVALHRLAVVDEAEVSGLAERFLRMTAKLASMRGVHIFRIDIKDDDSFMQKLLEGERFRYCGDIIYTPGNPQSKRKVFDKVLDD